MANLILSLTFKFIIQKRLLWKYLYRFVGKDNIIIILCAFLQEKMTEGADFKPFRALHQHLLQFICSYYLSDF